MNIKQDRSIIEALDNLNTLATYDGDEQIAVCYKRRLDVVGVELVYQSIHWLDSPGEKENLDQVVKGTLKTVFTHMKQFCDQEGKGLDSHQISRGAGSVMGIVGDAVKNMDRVSGVFQKSHFNEMGTTKEYQDIQSFYKKRFGRRRVAPEEYIQIQDKYMGEGGEAVESGLEGSSEVLHQLNRLEGLNEDVLYEFYFMRVEEGGFWLSPQSIRQMEFLKDVVRSKAVEEGSDPMEYMPTLHDKKLQIFAQRLYRRSYDLLNKVYSRRRGEQDEEFSRLVHKAGFSLMLAANSENIGRDTSVKNCSSYFLDFVCFTREALQLREYQRGAKDPSKIKGHRAALIKLIKMWIQDIYYRAPYFREINEFITQLLEQADHRTQKRKVVGIEHLIEDYQKISTALEEHSNGPILRSLRLLNKNMRKYGFDTTLFGNFPHMLYEFEYKDQSPVTCMHLPCPTHQEVITEAKVNPEFFAFLDGLKEKQEKILLFNLQDRTSWKEYSRSNELEMLSESKEYQSVLDVVTLNKNGEFYKQEGDYSQLRTSVNFLKTFEDQVLDQSTGYYFDENLSNGLEREVQELITGIWHIFFQAKNTLTRKERLDFIELFYSFFQVHLVMKSQPRYFAFVSKDGFDHSSATNTQLFLILKLMQRQLDNAIFEDIDTILYCGCLLQRERHVHPDCFQRMIGALGEVSSVIQDRSRRPLVKAIHKMMSSLGHEKVELDRGVWIYSNKN